MSSLSFARALVAAGAALVLASPVVAQLPGLQAPAESVPPRPTDWPLDPRLERLKAEAATKIDARAKMIQEIIDQVFSFGELGMQEVETSKFLTELLEKNGFTVQRGVAGIPTAWVATWGSGKPVISLGSDIDGIPQSNQKPAVGYRDQLVTGAPGHGEGHNSGQAVNIAAALVVKELMQREKIAGTLQLWPGVAEEQMAGKAHLVRAGVFKDVDVVLFTHVSSDFGTSWGQSQSLAMVSAEFRFRGQSSHAAGAPWRGKSALDAVMLMGQGWEYHREHMELPQRSHYVIKDGGDQPNVVPSTASIWFYFRERDYERVQKMFEDAKRIARGAAMMADVQLDTVVVLGSGWSGHFNRAVAEAMGRNIRAVGMPKWDSLDVAFAKGVQTELGVGANGLGTVPRTLSGPVRAAAMTGGGSDDIGDVSWNVPTITLRYPSNIPGTPGHNWADGIAMATPVAHKGAVAGAKAQAMTVLDLLLTPQMVASAWSYFTDEQTKTTKYKSFLGASDGPPVHLNAEIMARFRPEMRKYYYDPKKYRSYLEQLGIQYPTLRQKTPPAIPTSDAGASTTRQ
ncbi:MAG: amidohydrolase [Gemmatimonadaceae bacterium]|nr:amidohydrolase [Gemmatimonadaceae bacterium]